MANFFSNIISSVQTKVGQKLTGVKPENLLTPEATKRAEGKGLYTEPQKPKKETSNFFANILPSRTVTIKTEGSPVPTPKPDPLKPTKKVVEKPVATPLREAIGQAETRGVGDDIKRYSFSRHSGDPNLGQALGKYQVTEGELKTYSKRYLGRDVSTQEFIRNPKLQDEYMDNKINYWRGQGIDDDNIIVIHRGGVNAKTDDYKGYIDSVKSFIKEKTSAIPTDPLLTSSQIANSPETSGPGFEDTADKMSVSPFHLAKTIAQGTAESGAKVALAVKDITQGQKEPSSLKMDPTASKFEKNFFRTLFGKEEVTGLAQDIAETEIAIKPYTGDKSKFAVAPVLIGFTVADFLPGGKVAKTVGKELLEETTEAGIKTILKKQGIADDVIESFAPKFALASTKQQVDDVLETMGGRLKLTAEARKFKSADEFVDHYSKNVDQIPTTSSYKKYLKEQDSFVKREEEIYAEMRAMRQKYTGKTIKDVPANDVTKYEELQKELNKVLSKKTLADSPEGVIKTHIGEKGLKSELEDFYNKAIGDTPAPKNTQSVPGEASFRPDQPIPPTKTLQGEQQTAKMISSSDSLDSQYHTIKNMPEIKEADNILSPAAPNPKNLSTYSKFKGTVSDWWLTAREYVEDDWVRFKKILKDPNVKISDASNPYQKETLFHGKVASRLDEGKEIAKSIDQDIIDTAKKLDIPDQQISKDVNRYLIARHAPERNAAIGARAAGMSDEEAGAIIKEIDASPAGVEVKRLADQVQELNNRTLDVLKEGGVIDDELYTTLRNKYKNHVPLNRIFDESESVDEILSGRGLDVRSTGLKKAKGSEREVSDILNNVIANYEQAVIRAEKNIVDNATLKFARDNKHLGLFREIRPKPVGKTFKGDIILERITDPTVLTLREGGKPVYLKINDPHLAAVLKGVNRQKVDGLLRFVHAFTRLYSSLMTRFNPEFAFPNKIRDIQETMVYLASKNEIGFSGAVKAAGRDSKSIKDVFDFIRGADTDGAKLYKQMIEDGGTTGGLGLSTRKQVELDLSKIRALNRSKPRQAAQKLVNLVDDWNTLFEDSTRLSVYKQALESGATRDRAAAMAKEASINFNKMGKGGPLINSLYMFSNASIQGSAKLLRAMKNPKVAGTVITGVSGAVFAANEWNDRIDPEWREKVSKWDRLNGLTIVIPGGDEFNYITIPVSWGLKPIKVSAEYAIDSMSGNAGSLTEATDAVIASVIEAYNPVGGTDIVSAGVPTFLDMPVEIARNKAWSGSKIRPDFDQSAPASTQYFRSLNDTPVGRFFIDATREIAEKTGGRIELSPADVNYSYQQLIGGSGRFLSKVFATATDFSKGEVPSSRDVPFSSRFYRSIPEEEIGSRSNKSDEIKKILTEQSRERFYEKQDAEQMYEEMKKMPKAQAAEAYSRLAKENPAVAKRISTIAKDEKLGLTHQDRLVKELGVENGERAKYLVSQFNQLKTSQEKAALWKELAQKKIITEEVSKQIKFLLKKN